ncbi:MAG: ImmA/IrrE family metallo-endopeptidase [Emcibacter sp.]|nr:ImmA/IrrE family metallo-endopeptidase [Emcibacter sp.]
MMSDNIVRFPGTARAEDAERSLIPAKLRNARLKCRLNQSELAAQIGVSRQAVSAYELGDKNPEPQVMYQIAETLKQPIPYFTAPDLPCFGETGTQFYRAFGAKTKKLNNMSEVLGLWFTQVSRYLDDYVNYPEVQLPDVEPVSSSGRYSDEEIEKIAEDLRKAWGLGFGPISNIVRLLESKGILITRYEIEDAQVEAFSYWNGNKPFVFLSSVKESAVRSRFDVAHELGHLIMHRGIDQDEIEDKATLKEIEGEANRFAGAFLLPRQSFPSEIFTTRLDAFKELKLRWKVAIQAMIYRCKDLGIFDEFQITNLYKQISRRKWRKIEPYDDKIPFEQPRLLKRAVELLVDNEKKTTSEIISELSLSKRDIERLCKLPEGYFNVSQDFDSSPSLK